MAGSAAREANGAQPLGAARGQHQTPTPSAPVHLLNEEERRVLEAFTSNPVLTLGQLRGATALEGDELRPVLESLRHRGLLSQLNTVVESYRLGAEFSGGRTVGGASTRKLSR
jgi:hypothetical protein